MIPRRSLLKAAAAGGAVAGVGGFSALSKWAAPLLADSGDGFDPFRAPEAGDIDDASHVINRLTFGPRPGLHQEVTRIGARAYIARQLDADSIDDRWTDARARRFEALHAWPLGELLEYDSRELLDQLTRHKILHATRSRRQLKEVMVDFWSDHFNIDPSKGDSRWLKPADDRHVIRAHALGKFPDLLKASVLSPSMLWYLDGRVNQRASASGGPNENHARELLELHTMGVHGGYTQRDVMEVARCLSGWTVRERAKDRFAVGKVEFNPERHDDGPKTVLGSTIPAGLGEGDLDRVIDLLVRHPSTARFIAEKLCRRFIADTPPPSAIKVVADTFSRSAGDLRTTLGALFETPEFWASRGNRIKRPFHFVVSALRATAARTDGGPALQDHLLRLGHAPFQFPTPDGYPLEARPWMATLLWRWKFALDLAGQAIPGTSFPEERLVTSAGSQASFAAHLLGRLPTPEEMVAATSSGAPLAMLLASPAFQTF
ncbi:DUF1800 domain-containing protein [Luteolibacter marinus]|uniref:DUF1800 domain-containing protein n=1 Tax=Luteolibacter marinus TaxID=2776705 RepID=UPI0018673ED8|nr:DUF1800 domain-containing protein [Luteolibacter marinus]